MRDDISTKIKAITADVDAVKKKIDDLYLKHNGADLANQILASANDLIARLDKNPLYRKSDEKAKK